MPQSTDALPLALLGLVFDPVTLADAVSIVQSAALNRTRLVFATPNVNFSAGAAQDPEFRKQVLECRLSLVDGMPLVWIGRLLGLEIPERVAGSSLFEALQHSRHERPLRVFFFGGDPGVAQSASEALSGPGVKAAGYLDPGRGSIEDMSSDSIISEINAANADFLCVALGAVKGHHWIARNADRLNVPVISHLGAVVNFVARRISRAPMWMQRCGLEWAWRILREPKLVRRYAQDSLWLAGALLSQVLPGLLHRLEHRSSAAGFSWSIHGPTSGVKKLQLQGDLNHRALLDNPELRALVPEQGTQVTIDVAELRHLDSTGVAWLLRFCYSSKDIASIRLSGLSNEASRCLLRFGAGFIIREFA